MLKRAEPPICVGLYARWGAGKTFMISLLKKEFDETVREDRNTRCLLQCFDDGYEENGPSGDDSTVCCDIVHVLCLMLSSPVHVGRGLLFFVPYGVSTLASIFCDVLCGFWPKVLAKITPSSYSSIPQDDGQKKVEKKEFIFVHFNAWECAACLSPVGTSISLISTTLMTAQICPV